jgi:peptidoglycan hydrolase-like protein with peptidoglycan-binding domain
MSEANRRQIQEALSGLGYYKGPVDGIFGPKTRTAIRHFQRDQEGRHAQGVAGIKSECRARGSQPRREDAVGARLADRP